MSHMVIYRGADGKPGYHQTDEILDAVAFVERLRNEQAVEHARIFRLEEVQFEFRPYYRVELSAGGAAPGASGGNRGAVGTPERGQDEAPVEQERPVPAPAASPGAPTPGASPTTGAGGDEEEGVGSRRGLFGR